MACEHKNCSTEENDWLPYEMDGFNFGLKPHPYCIHCGTVKNISQDRAKRIGYYVNIISKMEKSLRNLTKVQFRLIVKDLEKIDGFEDAYWMTGSCQKRIFINIVKKYCNISQDFIASFM